MATLIGIAIGSAGLVGIGGLAKVSWIGIVMTIHRIKRKIKKKTLKQNLFISMNTINYNDFINVMYKIKNYDDEYHKNLYIKVQKQFFFNEKHFEDLHSFQRRFDSSFSKKEEMLKKLVLCEIEKSLSLFKERFDL